MRLVLFLDSSLKATVEGGDVPEDVALLEDEANKQLVFQTFCWRAALTRRRESMESSIDQDKRLRQEAEERLASKFGSEVVFEGISSATVAQEEEVEPKKEKKDWKQNEYVKLASEIGTDMVNMVKKSRLTEKTKEGVKKLEQKVKEEKEKHGNEKKDIKEVAKSSWGWLSSKTKKVLTAAVNGTKEYVQDIKDEFGPNAKKKEEDSEYDSEYSYYSDYSDYSEYSDEEENKKEDKKEEKEEEVDPNEP